MVDNEKIINCPACGKPMKKVFMPKQGVNLDVCVDGCGGIYFDNREFNKFDEPHEDISPVMEVLKNKDFYKVDQTVIRKCPVCGTDMVKNYASSRQEVQIDECYGCGGKFLDYGELEKIRSQYDTENDRADDVLKKLYYDVGSELIDVHSMRKNYNQNDGKNKGLIAGLIVAAIWLASQKDILEKGLNGVNYTDSAFITVIIVAIAIVAIFLGIGSLVGRSR